MSILITRNKIKEIIWTSLIHRASLSSSSLPSSSSSLVNYSNPETCDLIGDSFEIKEDFVNQEEEESLLKEVEPLLKRYKYDDTHIDNAIKLYKEIERSTWTPTNQAIIDRMRRQVFRANEKILEPVHVLDLSSDGFIKPHLDSVKFCGPSIGGLSLLSDCVMRFVHEKDSSLVMNVWLKRRSLYIMRDASRYLFKHEILGKNESNFNDIVVPRGRRISIICRCHPT